MQAAPQNDGSQLLQRIGDATPPGQDQRHVCSGKRQASGWHSRRAALTFHFENGGQPQIVLEVCVPPPPHPSKLQSVSQVMVCTTVSCARAQWCHRGRLGHAVAANRAGAERRTRLRSAVPACTLTTRSSSNAPRSCRALWRHALCVRALGAAAARVPLCAPWQPARTYRARRHSGDPCAQQHQRDRSQARHGIGE